MSKIFQKNNINREDDCDNNIWWYPRWYPKSQKVDIWNHTIWKRYQNQFYHFPAEGRTFLRTLRNSKPCVYVFFDGFCHGICFSTSKQLLALIMGKTQSYLVNALICIWEAIRLSFPPYVFEMFAALFMNTSLNPIHWTPHWRFGFTNFCKKRGIFFFYRTQNTLLTTNKHCWGFGRNHSRRTGYWAKSPGACPGPVCPTNSIFRPKAALNYQQYEFVTLVFVIKRTIFGKRI